MTCSIQHDEFATCVESCTAVTSLCTFSKQLDSLLNRLDNRCTMHGSQSEAIKCWCGNRSCTRYSSGAMPPRLQIRPPFHVGNQLAFSFSSSASCLGLPSLALCFPTMEDKRGLMRERSPSMRKVLRPTTPRLLHRRRLGLHHR
jgi:hypothetical protein